ncbi:MAG: pyridoxamine 5'-phosphate oxidase [Weeksellaceae bacterium]
MKQDLSDKRKDYSKNYIDFSSIPDNPIKLFSNWFSEVSESKLIDEPYAMNLANLDEDGFPRSRVVLLKEFNSDGFVFYTNYESQKGKALETNPNVCLSFFWDKLEQQVIIRGRAEKIAPIQSDAYFHRRPLESQVGALVSAQSRVIAFDKNLESEVEKRMSELKGQEVPRPDYWGGYLVRPVEIEFWQGRPSRLHDRLCYRLEGDVWKKVRLAP